MTMEAPKPMEEMQDMQEEMATQPTPVEEADPLLTERDEWKNKALRMAADMENLKKRTTKELDDARQYALTTFAREVLTVADNLNRALTTETEEIQKLKEGLTMVEEGLDSTLQKFKICKFTSLGEALDPNKHQVMVEIESDEPAGTIVQEMQPGYMLGERLLRPALVGTAKPKA